jgi:hypothetical protein
MDTETPNTKLTAGGVPASARDLDAVNAFALSFDGYAHWGERCGPRAEKAARVFRAAGRVPDDLSSLRACLFYEQGRLHWTEAPPDEEWFAWIQALLDAIRAAAGS